MALTFLCAGCSQAERDTAEAVVKAALGERSRGEPWSVSLVKVGETWSVTLDGPGVRTHSFVTPGPRLAESILERIAPVAAAGPGDTRVGPVHAPPPEAKPHARVVRDRQECHKCHRSFVVVYELEADESQETVSVACPHCWQMNQVLVAEAAAYTQAFRAEKLET